MTNIQAVLAHNMVVVLVTSAIWWAVYDKTGSNWSFLVFILAVTLHQGYREETRGKQ